MIIKVLGAILVLIGLLMLKFFPDMPEHQAPGFTLGGILIGVILIIVGIVLIFLPI